jgi:hypothetical protein
VDNHLPRPGEIDMAVHLANREKCFPPEELAKYAGEQIAFSADGTRVVAHGPDFLTLWNELKAAGIDPQECVWSDVPPKEWEGDL